MAIQFRTQADSMWRPMATIEVDELCGALDDILEDISFDSRLEAVAAPPEKLRFELVVNARRGPGRCAMAAYALLSALEAIAEDGGLPGFRIVEGAEWLEQVRAMQNRCIGDAAPSPCEANGRLGAGYRPAQIAQD